MSGLLLVGLLVPAVITLVVAIVLGLSLNNIYTGSYTGGTGIVKPANTAAGKTFEAVGHVSLDALSSGCACAGVAAAMGLVRFGVRNFMHPRVYGVYSFIVYLLLAGVLVSQIYNGGLTSITNPSASRFADQVATHSLFTQYPPLFLNTAHYPFTIHSLSTLNTLIDLQILR